jgi:tetratricopeptide (TPR) repeat protein
MGAYLLGGLVCLILGLVMFWAGVSFAQGPLAVGLFIVFQVLCVMPHELGHALAALAVGMRLFTVCVGTVGWIAFTIRLCGYNFVFFAVPFGGYTLLTPKSPNFCRLRYFIAILGGPLVDVLMLLGAIYLLNYWAQREFAKLTIQVFIAASVYDLARSLFPRNVEMVGKQVPNDGLLMLTMPRCSQDTIKAMHAHRFYLEGMESQQQGDFKRARRWLEQGLRENANDPNCRYALTLVASRQGNYDEARIQLTRWRELAGNSSEVTATFQNDIAWINLMSGKPDLRAEADDFSAKALQVIPWEPAFKGTRGSVLVELDRIDEGVHLLEQAFDENVAKQNKALNVCYLALAMSRKGDYAEAARYLARARRLDPKCTRLGRAESEIEERRAIASNPSMASA